MSVLGERVQLRAKLPGTRLNIVDVTVPPGGGTPLHSHASTEIYRILSGKLRISSRRGDVLTEVEAGPGDVVTMPAHAAHGYRNAGIEPAHFMAVVDDHMLAFFDAASSIQAPAGPPSPEVIGRVMELTQAHGIAVIPPQ
jgi:quercetin dioxygenase-like cupin family protein